MRDYKIGTPLLLARHIVVHYMNNEGDVKRIELDTGTKGIVLFPHSKHKFSAVGVIFLVNNEVIRCYLYKSAFL